jgi:hypothetical protein
MNDIKKNPAINPENGIAYNADPEDLTTCQLLEQILWMRSILLEAEYRRLMAKMDIKEGNFSNPMADIHCRLYIKEIESDENIRAKNEFKDKMMAFFSELLTRKISL